MKKVIISGLLALGLIGSAHAAGDADAGKSKAAACGACHGADGNSAAASFPKLAGQNEKYLIKQMQDIVSGARPVPTMAGQLDNASEQDLADIAAYFASQSMTLAQAKKDLLELGESIYRVGVKDKGVAACAACHSPTGQGNAGAAFPKLGGQHAAYVAAQLKAFRLGADQPEHQNARTNDGDVRMMRDVAYRLSDLEIDAVSSYISGLH